MHRDILALEERIEAEHGAQVVPDGFVVIRIREVEGRCSCPERVWSGADFEGDASGRGTGSESRTICPAWVNGLDRARLRGSSHLPQVDGAGALVGDELFAVDRGASQGGGHEGENSEDSFDLHCFDVG